MQWLLARARSGVALLGRVSRFLESKKVVFLEAGYLDVVDQRESVRGDLFNHPILAGPHMAKNPIPTDALDPLEVYDDERRSELHGAVQGSHRAVRVFDLLEFVPLFKSSKDEVTTQWPMGDIEDIGLLKMDFLGLRTLTLIDDCCRLIEDDLGETLDVDRPSRRTGRPHRLRGLHRLVRQCEASTGRGAPGSAHRPARAAARRDRYGEGGARAAETLGVHQSNLARMIRDLGLRAQADAPRRSRRAGHR